MPKIVLHFSFLFCLLHCKTKTLQLKGVKGRKEKKKKTECVQRFSYEESAVLQNTHDAPVQDKRKDAAVHATRNTEKC